MSSSVFVVTSGHKACSTQDLIYNSGLVPEEGAASAEVAIKSET